MVVCGPDTAGHSALDTTIEIKPATDASGTISLGTSATAGATTTLGRSLDNEVNSETARLALTNNQANLNKLSSLLKLKMVCVVDLDTLAQSDSMLTDQMFKYRANNAKIKSVLQANPNVIKGIRAQHPSFDLNKVLAVDIGSSGELILFVSSI